MTKQFVMLCGLTTLLLTLRTASAEDHPEYWSNDGVHFNGKGVTVEAEQVAKRIVERLK
jgi:lysophospholipase L1-like esterase